MPNLGLDVYQPQSQNMIPSQLAEKEFKSQQADKLMAMIQQIIQHQQTKNRLKEMGLIDSKGNVSLEGLGKLPVGTNIDLSSQVGLPMTVKSPDPYQQALNAMALDYMKKANQETKTDTSNNTLSAYQDIAKAQGLDVNVNKNLSSDRQAEVLNQLFQAKGLTPPNTINTTEKVTTQENKLNLGTPEFTLGKGGASIKIKSATSSGYGAAQLNYAKENASILADAVQQGDYAAIAGLSKMSITPIIVELRKRGVNVSEPLLSYKAQQAAMSNARLQEQKVESAISAQTLLDSSYDPQSGQYKVPPAQHAELAIAAARMLSPTGVVAQETISQLRQVTAREGLAGAAIWLGFDPKVVGGSTQSVIQMFAKLIKREGLASQDMLENLKTGKTTDFRSFLNKSDSPKLGQQNNIPKPKTQAEYDTIPVGTTYLHPTKGLVIKRGQ